MAAPQHGVLYRAPRRVLEIVYRCAQHLGTCDATRLLWLDAARCRPPAAAAGYTFRFLSAVDVLAFAGDPANRLDSSFADRLRCGQDRCFAALHGDKLAAYFFLAAGSIEAYHNRGRGSRSGTALSYGPQIAFAYNAFTLPEHRGRGLYPACMARALEQSAALGVTQLLTTTEWTNAQGARRVPQVGI